MTNTSTPIKYFKKEAKKLFLQAKASDNKALTRVTNALKNPDEISLMRAQHVIAVEYGFLKWEDLIKSSDLELQNAINKREATTPHLTWVQPRSRTPLGNFYRGPGIIPTSPENEALATFFDQMTQREQKMYLEEDARARGLISHC